MEEKKGLPLQLTNEQMQKNLRETGHVYGRTYNKYGQPLFCEREKVRGQTGNVGQNLKELLHVGDLVRLPMVHGWGTGTIESIDGTILKIRFRDAQGNEFEKSFHSDAVLLERCDFRNKPSSSQDDQPKNKKEIIVEYNFTAPDNGMVMIHVEHDDDGPCKIVRKDGNFITVRYLSDGHTQRFDTSLAKFIPYNDDIKIRTPSPTALNVPDLSTLRISDLKCYDDIREIVESGQTDNPLSSPGVYAWFFRKNFIGIPNKSSICIKTGLIFKEVWHLRYVGKAGKSLVSRIKEIHFTESAAVSTLRESLGSLLLKELDSYFIHLKKSYKLSNEDKLTKWMKDNAGMLLSHRTS